MESESPARRPIRFVHPHASVLTRVLSLLPPRSQALAACTCRAWRDAADDVELRLDVRREVCTYSFRRWLASARVANRVRAVRWYLSSHSAAFWFPGLTDLAFEFARMEVRDVWRPASLAMRLPVESLAHLKIHRLTNWHRDARFDVGIFRGLHRLETLRLAFDDSWAFVAVRGMGALPRLHTLEIRDAPNVLVCGRLRVDRVKLTYGGDLCWTRHATRHAIEASHLSLHSKHLGLLPLSSCISAATAPQLRTLELRGPTRGGIPCLRDMTRLETLALAHPTVVLDPGRLPAGLRTLRVDARLTLGLGGAGGDWATAAAAFPPGLDAAISVGGAPLQPLPRRPQ
jgi:hypothetical protein